MSIYLDNAATSFPKPDTVYRAVDQTLREIGVGPGRGGYRRGLEAGRLVFRAREAVSGLIGAGNSERIVFTHSATEALNLAVNGLLRPGDHVITTTMEHNSLARPLHLAEQRGVEVTWLQADGRGAIDSRQLSEVLRPESRLVALSHCSNVTGTIQPVAEIGAIARGAGVLFLVDAAQSAGSLPIDVEGMSIDLLAAPGHKGLLGPQGTGFLYVGAGIELTPLIVGGTGGHSSGLDQPVAMPEHLESGTPNTPGIAGLLAGIEFILNTGVATIRSTEQARVAQIVEGLGSIPGVTLYGPADPERRGSVVSFTVSGFDPSRIGFQLDQDYGISVRVGLHCAPLAHQTIGTYPEGTVRVSPGWLTTSRDIDVFLQALHAIVSQ
ncbi:MAG: cysteine desulfurase [Geobacter sp.]|nr:MAG: cysteine desulfurase [Geobacter sp.]